MKKNLLVIVVAIILGIVIGIIIRQERVKPLNQEPDTGIKSVNPKDIADAVLASGYSNHFASD